MFSELPNQPWFWWYHLSAIFKVDPFFQNQRKISSVLVFTILLQCPFSIPRCQDFEWSLAMKLGCCHFPLFLNMSPLQSLFYWHQIKKIGFRVGTIPSVLFQIHFQMLFSSLYVCNILLNKINFLKGESIFIVAKYVNKRYAGRTANLLFESRQQVLSYWN